MGIRFACHVCDKKLNIKSELAGRRGICPSCATRFRIPLQDAEKSSPIVDDVEANLIAAEGEPTVPAQSAASAAADPTLSAPSPTTILDDESEGTWYVRPPSGGQYGPANTELLKQWIDEGRVAATALLWREGWPQWRDASEALPELVAKLPDNENAGSQPVPQRQPTGPVAALNAKPNAAANGTPGVQSAGPAVIDSTRAASPKLVGQATVGTNRRQRSNRRVYIIGLLTALAALLIAALIFVANR